MRCRPGTVPGSELGTVPDLRCRAFALPLVRDMRSQLLSEAAAAEALFLAGLVMAPLHGEVGFLLFFLGPIAERIAPPGLLQIERRQLQVAPDLDGPLPEFPLWQRQRRV